jgi:hypothetical protein
VHRRNKKLHKTLAKYFELKRLFGGPTHRWEDNNKMNLTETGCENVNCTASEQGPTADFREHSNEPSGFVTRYSLSSRIITNCPMRTLYHGTGGLVRSQQKNVLSLSLSHTHTHTHTHTICIFFNSE